MTTLTSLADKHGTDKGEHQGFMPFYEKYLPSQNRANTIVELGVQQGNSIAMWEEWFKYSKIIGVDIDISQVGERQYSTRVELLQGEQDDRHLAEAICVYRSPDVVIDDASHISSKTIGAFQVWWPHVKPGGLYVVEDTHCSYDTNFYGAESGPPHLDAWPDPKPEDGFTTMGFLKRLADDVNWNYHDHNRFDALHKDIGFVHFYPGICFIGKRTEQ
jgi:8-demethyl-8-(2-methoxy-alpha-L-rhamnosyl)tetracenomycin-C 3'-O-methyltransferase